MSDEGCCPDAICWICAMPLASLRLTCICAEAQVQVLRKPPGVVPLRELLLSKIHTRTATIAVIGLGYVGPPLAVALRSGRAGLPRGRHRRGRPQGGRVESRRR